MSERRPMATREEVAEFLRVTVRTLDNWRRAGEGPPWHRLGSGRDSSVRYFWDEVEAWVREPKDYTKPGEEGPAITLTGEEALDALRELDRIAGHEEPDPEQRWFKEEPADAFVHWIDDAAERDAA